MKHNILSKHLNMSLFHIFQIYMFIVGELKNKFYLYLLQCAEGITNALLLKHNKSFQIIIQEYFIYINIIKTFFNIILFHIF